MKAADIQILQDMSQEVVDLLPSNLMVDGKRQLYQEGNQISLVDLMVQLEESREKMSALNSVIQKLQGRKSPAKNDEAEK